MEQALADAPVGDIIVRPSSRGTSHLTLSWKFLGEDTEGQHIFLHLNIDEHDKQPNEPLSMGRRLEFMGESYADLDELMARSVQPMVELCSEMADYDK